MILLLKILTIVLLAAVIVPMLLLLIVTLAEKAGWRFADRLMDVAVRSLIVEWVIGCLANIVFGLAIVGLGLWGLWAMPMPQRLIGLVIAPYGALRLWRGACGLIHAND